MSRLQKFQNTDGPLKPQVRLASKWRSISNNNDTVNVQSNWRSSLRSNQAAMQSLNSNVQIDTYGTFQPEEKHVYSAIWKENYFSKIIDLNEPRGTKYTCIECNENFCTQLSILTHSKIHRKHFCIACLLYCYNQHELTAHLTSCHAPLVELIMAEPSYSEIHKYDQINPAAIIFPPPQVVSDEKMPQVNKSADVQKRKIHAHSGTAARKVPFKTRSASTRKMKRFDTVERIIENPTKTLTSRFGRSITVKISNY